MVSTWWYSDYGDELSATGPLADENTFRYTGEQFDKETHLYYLRNRYMSPALGRFIQRDPIRYGSGPNMMAYCDGDPINFSDPSGLEQAPPGYRYGSGGMEQIPGYDWEADAQRFEQAMRGGEVVVRGAGMVYRPLGLAIQLADIASGNGNPYLNVKGAGPIGSKTSPHQTSSIVIRDGEVVQRVEATSGNMTPAQKAMGWRQGSNDSHTEPKTIRNTDLEAGDILVIKGTNKPCNACKGVMNRASAQFQATIHYVWGDKYWTAGKGPGTGLGLPGQR